MTKQEILTRLNADGIYGVDAMALLAALTQMFHEDNSSTDLVYELNHQQCLTLAGALEACDDLTENLRYMVALRHAQVCDGAASHGMSSGAVAHIVTIIKQALEESDKRRDQKRNEKRVDLN